MPTVESVGGRTIVHALVEVNINPADADAPPRVHSNWDELQAAFLMAGRADGELAGNNGTVSLPAGTIYATGPDGTGLGNIILDERHAGITIEGAGPAKTFLVDPYRSVPQFQVASRRISGGNRPLPPELIFPQDSTSVTLQLNDGTYAANDVLYFWTENFTATRSARQRVRVTDITDNKVSFTPALTSDWNLFRHMKGFEVNNGPTGANAFVTLTDPALLTQFRVNDTIYITDGPAINEMYGEWVTVTELDNLNDRVFFTPPPRRQYVAGLVAALPPPHMTDITFRNLSVAAPKNNAFGYMGTVTFGCRVRFDNVDFVPDGDNIVQLPNGGIISIGNAGNMAFTHCRMFGISFNTSHDVFIDDLRTRGVGGEEYCIDFTMSNLLIDGEGFIFSANGPCQRIHLRDSLILKYAIGDKSGIVFVDGSHITNVRMVGSQNTIPIFLNEKDLVLENVSFDKEVRFRGANARLINVFAPVLGLDGPQQDGTGPSSGIIMPSLLPGMQLTIAANAGLWRQPLYVARDGAVLIPAVTPTETPGLILTSPGAGKIPLTIKGALNQSLALQTWQSSAATPLFVILADGNVGTANATPATTLGNVVKRLPIKDAGGTLLGYVAIYNSIT